MNRMRCTALLVAALLAGGTAAADKPHVRLLATGGTIAGAQPADGSGHSYRAGVVGVEALVDAVPGLRERAEISAEQVMNIASGDMNDETWLLLVARVSAAVADPGIDAVVVTHGTDTLEESAFLLSLTIGGDKPVILVGSMRPATAVGADGPANLLQAVTVATAPAARARGVMVVGNNTIHGARDVTKANVMRPDAFESPNAGALGWVEGEQTTFYDPAPAPRGAARFALAADARLPRVDVIYVNAGTDGVLFRAAAEAGARGVVLAGPGSGSLGAASRAAVLALTRAGIAVVRTARHSYGPVIPADAGAGEYSDDALGTIAGNDLTPAKARVLLKLALMNPDIDRDALRRLFAAL